MRRGVLLVLAAIGAAVLAFGIVIGTSEALDRPGWTVDSVTTVDAPPEAVWDVLVDFDRYREWNPYMTQASATVNGRRGDVEIRLDPPGGEPLDVEGHIFLQRPGRKLRVNARLLLPSVRDVEYTVHTWPGSEGGTLLQQELRIEGLLSPLVDSGPHEAGLAAMAAAVTERVTGAP